jgi:hypothetical protein
VTFLDATALAEFIRLKKRMPGPAVVRLFGVASNIRKLLHITGLDVQFELAM